jgi:hypothetical protein
MIGRRLVFEADGHLISAFWCQKTMKNVSRLALPLQMR